MIVHRIKVNAHDERRAVFLYYSSDCARIVFTPFIDDSQTMNGAAFANPEALLANAPLRKGHRVRPPGKPIGRVCRFRDHVCRSGGHPCQFGSHVCHSVGRPCHLEIGAIALKIDADGLEIAASHAEIHAVELEIDSVRTEIDADAPETDACRVEIDIACAETVAGGSSGAAASVKMVADPLSVAPVASSRSAVGLFSKSASPPVLAATLSRTAARSSSGASMVGGNSLRASKSFGDALRKKIFQNFL